MPQSRRVPQVDFYGYTGTEHIIETGYDYRSLVTLSVGNEVVRKVHEAIVKESCRNRWESKERFNVKCKVCGAEYDNPKTKCDTPGCGNTSDWVYPNPDQKQLLNAFIEDPNADDEMKDIVESLMRYMLSVDDHWLSVQPPNIEKLTPLTVYVEDSVYMRVVSDEYGRIGNGEYFCPYCTKKNPTEHWKKEERCPRHPDVELKETAYVYVEGGTDVKARFAKDEVYHGKISPWLPGFYGNSKVISALRIILSIAASDKKNLDEYTTGRVKQILAAAGMTQDQANDMIAAALEQPKYKVEVNPMTGEKVVKDMQLVLGLGSGTDLKSIPGMPESEKMQSLEWWKLWRDEICSIYGVTPVFVGNVESGKTGNNPGMQINVQNNTTELYQKAVEDCFNNFVLPKLGVSDWVFSFNPVEEKDEMQDITVLNAKLEAMSKAVDLELDVELTDEGEVKVSGKPATKEEKMKRQQEQFNQQQQSQQATQGGGGGDGFPHDKPFSVEKAQGESWMVTKISNEQKKKIKLESEVEKKSER